MMPSRPMPDEDRFRDEENPDASRREDLDRAADEKHPDEVLPPEEERPESADERTSIETGPDTAED